MIVDSQKEILNPSASQTSHQPLRSRICKYATSLSSHLAGMAGSNNPPSPSRQDLEVDNPYDNDWGQAEDDDWPTLISSIEHGKSLIL